MNRDMIFNLHIMSVSFHKDAAIPLSVCLSGDLITPMIVDIFVTSGLWYHSGKDRSRNDSSLIPGPKHINFLTLSPNLSNIRSHS